MKIAKTPKSLYGFVAVGEAITWSLLLAGLLLRGLGLSPEWLIPTVGSIHGFMFLSYAVIAALVGVNQRWKVSRIVSGVALAIVPFATIPFDKNLEKKNLLDGAWRTQSSDHPGDASLIDRLFRWFIARPLILVLILVLAVSLVFTILLNAGPPDQWFK